MKCRNCQTEIAEKALICYRCGTATAEPRIPPPAERPARGPLPLVLTLAAIAGGAALLVPPLPNGPEEAAGWAAAAIAAIVAGWKLKPSARRHARWRR
jgi:hypothetical protein